MFDDVLKNRAQDSFSLDINSLQDRALLREIESARADPAIMIAYNDREISIRRHEKEIKISRDNAVYVQDMWRQFDYYFETVVPEERSSRLIVDYSVPKWHVIRQTGDRFFFSSLAEDMGSVEIYKRYLNPRDGDVVIDLGAYCGLSTITAARLVGPTGKVYAVEADPKNYEALTQNILTSGQENITAIQKAIFADARSLWFSSEGSMGSAVLSSPVQNRGNLIEVKSISLDQMAEEFGLQRVDALKIDIESSEYTLIPASVRFLEKFKPKIVVELHANPWPGGPLTSNVVRDVFDNLGYFTKFIRPDMMVALPE